MMQASVNDVLETVRAQRFQLIVRHDFDSLGFVTDDFLHGTAHKAHADLQAAMRSYPEAFALWQSLTPLGRNEFICWVEDAKQPATLAASYRASLSRAA
jgi:Bacteriocin-protection, YdeI or OmpD-Associated